MREELEAAIAQEFRGRSYPNDQGGRDALARQIADFILAWVRKNRPGEEFAACDLAGLIDGRLARSWGRGK